MLVEENGISETKKRDRLTATREEIIVLASFGRILSKNSSKYAYYRVTESATFAVAEEGSLPFAPHPYRSLVGDRSNERSSTTRGRSFARSRRALFRFTLDAAPRTTISRRRGKSTWVLETPKLEVSGIDQVGGEGGMGAKEQIRATFNDYNAETSGH